MRAASTGRDGQEFRAPLQKMASVMHGAVAVTLRLLGRVVWPCHGMCLLIGSGR